MGRESGAIPVPAASGLCGPQPGANGYVTLSGYSLAETAGTSTRVELRDGGSATGNIVAVFTGLTSSSSPLLPNVKVNTGLYVKLTGGGTVVGSIYFA